MGSIKIYQSSDPNNLVNDESDTNIANWCNKLNQVWERSDFLFGLLRSPDYFYQQPIRLRLPLIFYLGHLPCFSWLQFRHLDGVNKVIDPLYDELFQRGVDPDVLTGTINHMHSSRFSLDSGKEKEYWRQFTVQSVDEYKLEVRSAIRNILINGNLNFNDVDTLNILNVTVEHEMMHQETLTYLFLQLPIEALGSDVVNEDKLHGRHSTLPLPENPWIALPGGQVSLGKSYNEKVETFSFGWDNEFPCYLTYVSSFEMQSHPVRIGDFLQFVQDNGYTTKEWWDDDVFNWINESRIYYPATWSYDGSYCVNFIFQRSIPIESVLDHPVIVSQIEAKAYCAWLSHKCEYAIDLPTEPEWIYAMWDLSKCLPEALANDDYNANFRHFYTMPLNPCTDNKLQWQGSAHEWTSSTFGPFPGYRGGLPSYPGYSADFFDDRHFVVLGGSFATDLNLIRRSFRNWYQSRYRFAFATFRCVKRNEHTDDPLTAADRGRIIATLSNPNHRSISSQYFYDAHGSAIYEQITRLDEYYPYTQELKLLRQRNDDIKRTILEHSNFQASSSTLSKIHIIELGCGDGSKVEAWLPPWLKSNGDVSVVYHPVDVSQHAIDSLIQRLTQNMGEAIVKEYVEPICSTFSKLYTELKVNLMEIQVVLLLGSTIGNFATFDSSHVRFTDDSPVVKFLRSIRSNLKIGDWFLCAFDICKETKTMIQAYNDSKGTTAAFNYNLLLRLNRELGFNFKVTNYQHYATFNPLFRQMESWLISTKRQTVSDQHGFVMELQPYEPIQTEVSVKYTKEDFRFLMEKNSFKIIECYTTSDQRLPYALCMAQAV